MTKKKSSLVDLARHSLEGLEQSRSFVGIFDEGEETQAEFLLQLGYCVMNDKTVIIPAPQNVKLPKKLELIADVIVRYDPNDLKTLRDGVEAALLNLAKRNTH